MRHKLFKSKIFSLTFFFSLFCFIPIQILCVPTSISSNSLSINTESLNIAHLQSFIPQSSSKNRSEWDNVLYTMLLITPYDPEFINLANKFAIWKTYRGIPALVVSNWSHYFGRDDPERIRNTILSIRNQYPIQWILLMGSTDKIPIRTIYNPDGIIVGESDIGDSYQKPTDLYYANLDGTWNMDNDSNWGEMRSYNDVDNSQDEIDWTSELYVGRFPANSILELSAMINKTITYEKGIYTGTWNKKMLAASTVLNLPSDADPGGEDEAWIAQYIIDNYIGNSMSWTHIFDEISLFVPEETTNFRNYYQTSIRSLLNQGKSILFYGGHGGNFQFSSKYDFGNVFGISDVSALTNVNMPVMVYADACLTNAYDFSSCLGESMLNSDTTGAIGYIGAMRISWYYANDTEFQWMNRALSKLFFQEMFGKQYFQQGKALYESKNAYVESEYFQSIYKNYDKYDYWCCEVKSLSTYMLLGDPSIDIYTDSPQSIIPLFDNAVRYYEGSEFSFQIRNKNNHTIPYATVSISSTDGKYQSFIADGEGNIKIKLPYGARIYNYTIFGHNSLFLNGSFEVFSDANSPIFLCTPSIFPSELDASVSPIVEISIVDEESGIRDAWIIISSNEFVSCNVYAFNAAPENRSKFFVVLPKLDYAYYEYVIFVYDFVNNMNFVYEKSQQSFVIPTPVELYILIVGNILMIIGIGMKINKRLKDWKKLF